MDVVTSLELHFTIRDVHQDFMVSRKAIGVSKQIYQAPDISFKLRRNI